MRSFTRPSRRQALVTGIAGVAVIGAVGVGSAAFAAGPTPSPGASAPAAPSGAPSGAPGQGTAGTDAPTPPKHEPHIGGEVLTVDGSTVTVKDPDGFTRTIALASDAKVTKDGSTSSVAAITKGTHIEATGTVDANGTTLDATSVTIGMPTPPAGGPAAGPAHGQGPAAAPQPRPRKGGHGAPVPDVTPSGTPSTAPSGS